MAGRTRKRIALATVLGLVAAYSIVLALPATAAADAREQRNQSIRITKDAQFTTDNGVRFGSGTKADPYVISGWDVFEVHLADTSKHVVIRDNTIQRLILNWNGDRLKVVHNDIGDMRVNQNVKRTGDPTTGLIAHNKFGVVGQLRHFDGVFAHNVVGAPTESFPFFGSNRAVNFDGFHGARFFDNVLYGYLEVRLHGHHHGSNYDAASHYHGSAPEQEGHEGHGHAQEGTHEMEMVDHSTRYHKVHVYDNTIHADGPYALIYTDSNHAGNDRTATSETNKELNKPHEHFTKVFLTDNKLRGAGLVVDIFNAEDERHTNTNRGLVEIARNNISLSRDDDSLPWDQRDGISIGRVVDLDLRIVGNDIAYEPAEDMIGAALEEHVYDIGISLQDVDKADVVIARNSVADMFYGVSASRMTESVQWTITGLETNGVSEPVAYDDSVKNRPRGGP